MQFKFSLDRYSFFRQLKNSPVRKTTDFPGGTVYANDPLPSQPREGEHFVPASLPKICNGMVKARAWHINSRTCYIYIYIYISKFGVTSWHYNDCLLLLKH